MAARPTAPEFPSPLPAANAEVCRGNGNRPTSCQPLASLPPGETATLCHLGQGGALRQRLSDLGFVHGTLLRVVRRAPLGDPLELELRGTRLCLREEDARIVWVHPQSALP